MALLTVPVIVGTGAYAVMRMIAPKLLQQLTTQGVKNIKRVPKEKLFSVPKSTPRLTTNDAKKLVDGKPILRSSKKLSNKPTTPKKTKRPVIEVSPSPASRTRTKADKAIMGTIGTLGAGAAVGAVAEKLSKKKEGRSPGALGGKIPKGPKRVNTVRPYQNPFKDNKKMLDKKASLQKIKDNKKNKLVNKRKPPTEQERRLSKVASENLTKTNTKPKLKKKVDNKALGYPKIERPKNKPAPLLVDESKLYNRPSSYKVKKGPARSVKEAQTRNLPTFTNKAGKKLAAVSKEQLDKSGLSLRDFLNKKKGLTRKKPTTKKMGGGKVYRRGGGRALRGMGKAIYSNKMY